MDSGSTPGNPYVSEREGLDIFQKVPYSMPIMRRSTKFQTRGRLEQRKHTSLISETFGFENENGHITASRQS